MSGFDKRSDLPPPHYDWSQQDYDSKVANAIERSLHQSFAPVSGPSQRDEDEFETWTDEKFEAAARAFEARQAKRRTLGTPQAGASGSSSGSASNRASSSGTQYDVSEPEHQTYLSYRSRTPRPSDYAVQPQPQPQPYSRAPATTVPATAPAFAPPAVPQPPTPPYALASPPSSTTSNEGIVTAHDGLQRAVSLFRTPSVSRHDDGEQLPAFTDVARPEEMVPQHMARPGPTSPPPPPIAPQSPPPPHTFSPPSGPPPSLHNVKAQTGPISPVPRSPPPPHSFSAPSSPPPPPPPPPLPPFNVSRSPPLPVTVPASPTQSDPPPVFVPSTSHYPIPEKTNSYGQPQLDRAKVMSSSVFVYAPAQPTIKFDLEAAAYGRSASPAPPKDLGASFYSAAVTSTMKGRSLPKPGGARPRSTLGPLAPEPSWTGMGSQPGTYGGPNQTGPYPPQYQHPYQPGSFYGQPLGQQPYYGQNQPPPQSTHWDDQYPNYRLTTPPPGGQGQHAGWGVPPPAAPWPGNGGHYRQ